MNYAECMSEEKDVMSKEERRAGYLFGIACIIAVFIIVSVNIHAGKSNFGIEGDEAFSYISSTSLGGFKGICYLDDQTWYEASYFINALTVNGEEKFNIKMVAENQAMDTHPPLYYIFLNFVCSIFEGQYSRWFGIGLNIFFILFVAAGLFLLLEYFLKNKYMSLVLSTIFCCSYLSVTMVIFIRMYVLLMALVLFQSWFHLRLYDRMSDEEEFSIRVHIREYAILVLITILGGLTHYYFLVYQVLIAALFVSGLWVKKKKKNIIRYICSMCISAVVYVCLYPAVITHIFFKYRGRDAVHKFLKEGTLFGDVISMLKRFDESLFKGCMLPILLVLVIISIILLIKKKIHWKVLGKGVLLVLPSLIYFFGISKASPYVDIRYVSPVAALFYSAVIVWTKYLIDHSLSNKKWKVAGCMIGCIISLGVSFWFGQKPIKAAYFLERENVVNEIAKEADYCVYITGDEYNWKMWEDYVNYPKFDGLFFIDGQKKMPITDTKLLQQDKLCIYVDTALDLEDICAYLQEYLSFEQYIVKYETSYTYILLAE